MKTYHYIPGTVPVLISIPHAGTFVPHNILDRFTTPAKRLPDTDWHVETLYAFARDLGIHMLIATHSRYVIDLNRGKDDQSLYPGKFTTGLCPLTLFDGTPVYQPGMEPNAKEIQERIETYWQPYHDKLQSLVDDLKKKHNRTIVFDAHSIRSQVPLLFDGVLPDLNIGTADGLSAKDELIQQIETICKQYSYSYVINGRFKGGFITRHYGKPEQGIQAIQLELAQCNYMNEAYPFSYDDKKAKKLQILLMKFLEIIKAC